MLTYRNLQLRRGNKADLPTLQDGEPGFCTDSLELFIGNAETGQNEGLGYLPISPSNWVNPAPKTISEALDRLSALLVSLHGGPIP